MPPRAADIVGTLRELTSTATGPTSPSMPPDRPEIWEQAMAVVGRGGTVVFFGGCAPGTTVSIDTRRAHYEELSLVGAFHHTPDLDPARRRAARVGRPAARWAAHPPDGPRGRGYGAGSHGARRSAQGADRAMTRRRSSRCSSCLDGGPTSPALAFDNTQAFARGSTGALPGGRRGLGRRRTSRITEHQSRPGALVHRASATRGCRSSPVGPSILRGSFEIGVEPVFVRYYQPVEGASYAGLGFAGERWHFLSLGRFVPYVEAGAAAGAVAISR